MKIAIVSDTHRETEFREQLRHESVDAIFHAGDSELPKSSETMCGMYTVRGNMDQDPTYEEELVVDCDGVTIWMTHGHLYAVNQSLQSMYYRACEHEADLVIFGHTHRLGAERIGDILFVNPGSFSTSRDAYPPSYAIVEHVNAKWNVTFFTSDGTFIATEQW